jgi:hypothetical protein
MQALLAHQPRRRHPAPQRVRPQLPFRAAARPREPILQAKLAVSSPGDAYEQEADRVVDQVMRMPASSAWTPCSCGGGCPRCKDQAPKTEALPVGRLAGPAPAGQLQGGADPAGAAGADLASVVAQGTSGGGTPLDREARAFMEPRFGRDFGHVRVHADGGAARSARAINAVAYTVGSDIVFGAGRYAPHTAEGRRLLAHELTHTIQQRGGQQGEGDAAMVGRSVAPGISSGAGGLVQRIGECDGKTYRTCSGSCVPADGRGTGFCAWSGSIATGCICYRRDQPMLREAQQFLFNLIIAALIAAGIVLAVAAIAAIIACLSGPCEVAALIAALGYAGAMIVLGIIRGGGGGGASTGGSPTAEAGGGEAGGESAPA